MVDKIGIDERMAITQQTMDDTGQSKVLQALGSNA